MLIHVLACSEIQPLSLQEAILLYICILLYWKSIKVTSELFSCRTVELSLHKKTDKDALPNAIQIN